MPVTIRYVTIPFFYEMTFLHSYYNSDVARKQVFGVGEFRGSPTKKKKSASVYNVTETINVSSEEPYADNEGIDAQHELSLHWPHNTNTFSRDAVHITIRSHIHAKKKKSKSMSLASHSISELRERIARRMHLNPHQVMESFSLLHIFKFIPARGNYTCRCVAQSLDDNDSSAVQDY